MSIEEPDLVLLANLRLEVREAYRRGRWAWQIVDARNGSVFERAFEFASEESARRSGLARLAEVLTPLRARDILQLIAGSISTNHLVIVSRDAEALHQQPLGLFREGAGVDVIRDRRRAERRRCNAVKVRGWCVVARADDGDVCDEPDGSATLSAKKNRDDADLSLSLETTSRAL